MECAICLEFDSKNFSCPFRCKHLFHYNCIKEMFRNSKFIHCPMCREKLKLVYYINYIYSKQFIKNILLFFIFLFVMCLYILIEIEVRRKL